MKKARQTNRRVREIRALLIEPASAFLAAWETGKRRAFVRNGARRRSALRCPDSQRQVFAQILQDHSVDEYLARVPYLGGSNDARARALDEYLKIVAELMMSWEPYQRQDNGVLAWFDGNQYHVRKMHEAQRARVTLSERPSFFRVDPSNKPTLEVVQKFTNQKTFRQAARTAAYCLWGTFLSGDPFEIQFCEKCLMPFPFRKSKRYCLACSTGASSNKSHKNDIRKQNWVRLREVAPELRWRLANGDSKSALTNLASGRWLARFIRAAKGSYGTDTRDRMVELCTSYESPDVHRWAVHEAIDSFLEDIRRALS